MELSCAVLISTHNRRAELTRTLSALRQLDPRPDEIIICADGCSDGTPEFVRAEYPEVRLLVHDPARGSIPSRNELAAVCISDLFLSLDDDSYPIEPDFIARLRQLFAATPRLAVAAFPQRSDEWPETLTATDFGPPRFIGSYANSGAAIRCSVFRALGGYPDFFFHAYEEPDFALRCLADGWQVKYETGLSIRHHFTSTQRNELRTHQRHARNEFWSVLLRCPGWAIMPVALFRAASQLRYAAGRGPRWALAEPRWWIAALAGVPRCLARRQPVPWGIYLAWMRLVRTPLRSGEEWNALFRKPPL